MPWHVIDPASNPIALPVSSEKMPAEIMYQGTSLSFNEFLKKTDTNAFIVIRNGVMSYEWYKDGVTQSTQLPSYSVGKTMTSIMIIHLSSRIRPFGPKSETMAKKCAKKLWRIKIIKLQI
jgi:hypothetical protein